MIMKAQIHTIFKMIQILYLATLITLCNGGTYPVARAKAKGPGYTLPANSAKTCHSLCEAQPACDSANYEKQTGKCRVFSRCTSSVLLYNSDQHVHFAKRPMIKEPGYMYHAESDSCVKLIEELTDYAEADNFCKTQNGRLVSLTDPGINQLASELLKNSKVQYAWVGATDNRYEGNPQLTDGRRVSETGWFPAESQESRQDPRRNCWSLSDNGSWAEHSCKNRTHYSICQIVAY